MSSTRPAISADMRLVSWSMAKSVTQALVGVAVQQGRVDIDQSDGQSALGRGTIARAEIPWRTWLQMTDGQRYLEIEAKTIADSDASRKLFGPGRLDVARYCAGLPLIHEPGTYWNYNSCGIVLTADALTRAIVPNPPRRKARRAAMMAWMRESLFDVIGMNAQPEFDATGLFYGSAFVYASARDFAKFGLLYLRDGMWDGRRVLPRRLGGLRSHAGHRRERRHLRCGLVGESAGRQRPSVSKRASTSAPQRDAFSAQGFEGQYTLVVPSKDLVIVRLGSRPRRICERERFGTGWGAWRGRFPRRRQGSNPQVRWQREGLQSR